MSRPKKRFSQNFLKNKSLICDILTELELKEEDNIIEIGPGRGALLDGLLEEFNFKSYTGIEIDKELHSFLASNYKDGNIEFIREDFLKYNQCNFKNIKIVGNIPYNITTPIIMKLIKDWEFQRAVLTVQKEYAERLCAAVNTKEYSALSVTAQNTLDIDKITVISKRNFFPAPKVDSAVIKINPSKDKNSNFEALNDIKKIFSKRRKKIYNTLRKDFNIEEEILSEIFLNMKFDINARPQNIKPADFLILMRKIKEVKNGN